MKKLYALALFGALALSMFVMNVEQASAIPAFKTEFDNMYVDKAATDGPKKALLDEVEKVKCNVCHVGKDKKMKNEYGKALGKLLNKKTDAKDVEKIKGALEKVAGEHSKPGDDASPTFGDLIKEGKLPSAE